LNKVLNSHISTICFKCIQFKFTQDDSDDEDEDKDVITNPRKRKRYRRRRRAKQQWILQTNDEFVHKMKIEQIKKMDKEKGAMYETDMRNKLSNRYKGLPESNNSQYVLLSATQSNGSNAKAPSIEVTTMHGYISFNQPSKFKTLSMQDAEEAIASKNVSRYMMHGVLKKSDNGDNSHENAMLMSAATKNARSRLLGNIGHSKLENDDDYDDDVMMDVAFREQKAGVSVATRQELLNDFGDGIKVDHDGIIGGANDSEFAGGRRFGQMKNGSGMKNKNGKNSKDDECTIDDDFYQKDVGAQFDNVDCDVAALFDNNDEYMGTGVQDDYDLGGFADVEDDDSDADDEDEIDLDAVGKKSFATKTGMKELLAKASGEAVDTPHNIRPLDLRNHRKSGNLSSGSDRSEDEKDMVSPKSKPPELTIAEKETKGASLPSTALNAPNAMQVDENGLRIISKDAVRREIWLHNGSLITQQLFKKFKAGKKYPDRKKVMLQICLELCTINGSVLSLKQHYAKM
jgi:hypothetical protein